MSRSRYRGFSISWGGPQWWRRATRHVPLRREARQAIHRFIRGERPDVTLTAPNRRTQWWY